MECQFPHFRQKFWGAAAWHHPEYDDVVLPTSPKQKQKQRQKQDEEQWLLVKSESYGGQMLHSDRQTALLARRKAAIVPEIKGVRDVGIQDGPETETRIRRQHFAEFENDCSEVSPGLFVAGEAVAKNREILHQHNITHIINCVGYAYEAYFSDEIEYLTLYLLDSIHEDIMCVLYTCFDFIQEALNNNGNVLVHCSQGVSRSVAIATGYLMWKHQQPYKATFEQVKSIRGVASPNIGFACALMQWEKKLNGEHRKQVHLQRIFPHVKEDPLRLVPKSFSSPPQAFDPRLVYIILHDHNIFVWQGKLADQTFKNTAQKVVSQILMYERIDTVPQTVQQGEEPNALIEILIQQGRNNQVAENVDENGVVVHEQSSFSEDLERFVQLKKELTPKKGGDEGQVGTPRKAEVEITSLDSDRQRKHARNVHNINNVQQQFQQQTSPSRVQSSLNTPRAVTHVGHQEHERDVQNARNVPKLSVPTTPRGPKAYIKKIVKSIGR